MCRPPRVSPGSGQRVDNYSHTKVRGKTGKVAEVTPAIWEAEEIGTHSQKLHRLQGEFKGSWLESRVLNRVKGGEEVIA